MNKASVFTNSPEFHEFMILSALFSVGFQSFTNVKGRREKAGGGRGLGSQIFWILSFKSNFTFGGYPQPTPWPLTLVMYFRIRGSALYNRASSWSTLWKACLVDRTFGFGHKYTVSYFNPTKLSVMSKSYLRCYAYHRDRLLVGIFTYDSDLLFKELAYSIRLLVTNISIPEFNSKGGQKSTFKFYILLYPTPTP